MPWAGSNTAVREAWICWVSTGIVDANVAILLRVWAKKHFFSTQHATQKKSTEGRIVGATIEPARRLDP